jgi:hypothetical protein
MKNLYLPILLLFCNTLMAQNYFTSNGIEATAHIGSLDDQSGYRLGYVHTNGLGISIHRIQKNKYSDYYGSSDNGYSTIDWGGNINYTLNLNADKRFKMNFVGGLSSLRYSGKNFLGGGGFQYNLGTNIYYNILAPDKQYLLNGIIAPIFGFTYRKDQGSLNTIYDNTVTINSVVPETKFGILVGGEGKHVSIGASCIFILLFNDRPHIQVSATLGTNF